MAKKTSVQAFVREPKLFKLLGKEFKFLFIPSIHFQEILKNVVEVLLSLEQAGEEVSVKPDAVQNGLIGKLQYLLEDKIYQILQDVLFHQNDERVDMQALKYKTSPTEIAEFLDMLIGDDEVIRALEVVTGGMGKLLAKINKTPLPTPNSLPSA